MLLRKNNVGKLNIKAELTEDHDNPSKKEAFNRGDLMKIDNYRIARKEMERVISTY